MELSEPENARIDISVVDNTQMQLRSSLPISALNLSDIRFKFIA